jgi:alpha-ketoglutarate-dependent taurine dioxygenase
MINHRPLHPTMGSLVIDKRLTDFSDEDIKELKHLILDRRAIFFENQFLSDEEMLSVADRLKSPGSFKRLDHIDNTDEAQFAYGYDWHSDKVFQNVLPNYTIFQMNSLPDNSKGDTEFLDTVNFFEHSFSEPLKTLFLDLDALYEMRTHAELKYHVNELVESQEVWHRSTHRVVLRTEMRDGTILRSMLVNPSNTSKIVGLKVPESDAIIRCIIDTMYRRSEYKYRHKWKEGGLVIWSNRVCQHRGIKDFPLGFERKFSRAVIY